MKAARYYGIQDVRCEEIEKPNCEPNEVVIKVAYSGICGSDLHIYNKGMFIQNIPETMGHEFSGVIEEIGSNIKRFKIGDKVIANPMVTCMKCESCKMGSYNTCANLGFIGEVRPGCFASHIAIGENTLIKVPDDANLRKMALAEPLAVALNICDRAKFSPEDDICLIGVGPIGLLTILAAKNIYGVKNITAVDISEVRLGLAEKAGATTVYKKIPEELKFNKVIEAAGQPITFETAVAHTKPNGYLYVVSIFEKEFTFDINGLVASQISLVGCNVYTAKNLEDAVSAIAQNKVDVEMLISAELTVDKCQDAFGLLNSPDKSVAKVLFKF